MYAGAGLGTILGNTQVFYVALVGILFYKERPSLKFLVSVLLAFFGIYLLVGFHSMQSVHDNYPLGVAFGLITGVVYASYILVMRKIESLSKSIPTEQALAFVSLICSLVLLIVSAAEGTLVWPETTDWVWLVGLALVSQVIGWLLITRALPKTPVSRAGLILNTQPVVAVVAGDLLLGEKLTPVQMVGAALTLSAIYLGTQRSKTKV